MGSKKLLVVDDHKVLLEGIVDLIDGFRFDIQLDSLSDSQEALGMLEEFPYDLLITDYEMPNLNGAQLTKAAKRIQPKIKVIVLSMHEEPSVIKELIDLNIDGFVLKKEMLNDLKLAVSSVLAGGYFFSTAIDPSKTQQPVLKEKALLSSRESDILKLIGGEFTNKEIAERLQMNENTVRVHEKNIMRKTRMPGRKELIAYAHKLRH